MRFFFPSVWVFQVSKLLMNKNCIECVFLNDLVRLESLTFLVSNFSFTWKKKKSNPNKSSVLGFRKNRYIFLWYITSQFLEWLLLAKSSIFECASHTWNKCGHKYMC